MSKKSSLALALVLSASAAARNLQRFESAEPHMGTLFRITVYASDTASAKAAFQAAFARITQLDESLSDYKPNSELMHLCRAAYLTPTPVSADLYTVLEKAQQVSRETGGAFDVTLGPLTRLWREARKTKTLPPPEALAQAQGSSGYTSLVLDSTRKTVELRREHMQVDLGGIAKGYAADEALHILHDHGIKSALVAASGDLSIGDAPPGKPGWRVALDLPGTRPTPVLTLHNAAVSTSGDAEQYIDIAGAPYSHIIDPKTGLGLTQRMGVSVTAPRGIDADSYATALCVLTAQHGVTFALAWAEQRAGLTARIAYLTPDGWKFGDTKGPGGTSLRR